MPSLNNLPVELVIEILRGASLTDILSVIRTSAFFRAVGFSSRSLWKNARDAERLPLPMGQTLDTFPLSAIGKLAAYASALSAVWRRPIAHPRRVSHVGPCPSQPRSRNILISPHGTILPGNQWLLIDMDTDFPHVYSPFNGEFIPLGVEGKVVSYAYESQTNGASVIVAVLNVRGREPLHIIEKEKFIDVYVLQFDPELHCRAAPSITRALSIRLPVDKYLFVIDLKGPLVVVSGVQDLFIVNWQERSGVNLSTSLNQELDEESSDEEIFCLNAFMHPQIPLLLAEKHTRLGHPDSIHVVHFPAILPPFEGSDLADRKMRWPKDSFKSTRLHTLELPQTPQYRGFRRDWGGSLILDIISIGDHPEDLSHLSISGLDGTTPKISCRNVSINPDKHIREVRTTSGNALCLCRSKGYEECPEMGSAFLRMPGEDGEDGSWVGLEIPVDVNPEVLAFDDVYGTLLLHDFIGNYCVVQY